MSNAKVNFRIVTFNIWSEGEERDRRLPLIAHAMGELKPDFVGLQEVFRPEDLVPIKEAGLFRDSFTPDHKTGLGLLTQGRIESTQSFMLPFSPLEEYRRYIILARVRFGKILVNFYNTHLSWKPEDGKTREIQADALLGFVRAQPTADLDLLTGDLNAIENTSAIEKLAEHFTDLYRLRRPGERGLTWSHKNKYTLRARTLPERRIDYVLAGNAAAKKINVTEASVVFNHQRDNLWLSDHFGVCVDMEFDIDG